MVEADRPAPQAAKAPENIEASGVEIDGCDGAGVIHGAERAEDAAGGEAEEGDVRVWIWMERQSGGCHDIHHAMGGTGLVENFAQDSATLKQAQAAAGGHLFDPIQAGQPIVDEAFVWPRVGGSCRQRSLRQDIDQVRDKRS